jgi:hypothetical protein
MAQCCWMERRRDTRGVFLVDTQRLEGCGGGKRVRPDVVGLRRGLAVLLDDVGPSNRREGGDDTLLERVIEIRRLEGSGGGKRACASSSRARATSHAREADSSLLCDDSRGFGGSRANGGGPRVTVERGASWRRLRRPLETAKHRPPSWSIG